MDDLSAWIALSQLRCLSLLQKHTLLQHCSKPQAIFELDPRVVNLDLKPSKPRIGNHIDYRKLDQTLEWLQQSDDYQIIHFDDPHYPQLLKQISSAPLLLYLLGNHKLLNQPQIAVVGSRKATLAGKQIAGQFSAELTMSGLTVTSGMALGVDSAAHDGALKSAGSTIAVLGTGVDLCYPRANRFLYERIAAQGLLISEFELGSAPKKAHFPMRNRIISGLSLGVLVVEATERSGSLITANYAIHQNREVFAIPGSIHANTACGCLALIQQGVKLARSSVDILEEFREFSALSINNNEELITKNTPLTTDEDMQILQFITDAPVSFDKLVAQSGLTIDQLCSMLLDLEVCGMIEKLPGNLFIRTAN